MNGVQTTNVSTFDRLRTLRRLVVLAYVAGLAAIVAIWGVPTSRIQLMSIVIVGLGITAIGPGPRRFRHVLRDWLPFTACLLVYDLSRGIAKWIGLPVHEQDVVSAEKALFGGTVPTVWLQDHFYNPHVVHWYDAAATLVYTTHFLATPILAGVLWIRNRQVWLAYVRRVIALAVAGLVTYVLFPSAPPWMAARDHLIDPVSRLSARGWIWLHAGNVNDALETAQRDGSNPVAAIPSLHTAFATLVALFVVARLRSRWRHLVWLYPVAMGLTLAYTGEHYVIDILAGVAYALGVHVLVSRWERARRIKAPQIRADQPRETQELGESAPDLSDVPVVTKVSREAAGINGTGMAV